jgi:hypothetical protein
VKNDIAKLVANGERLMDAMILETFPADKKKMSAEKLASVPRFIDGYQSWYSEALSILSQLLPTRVNDFKEYYSFKKQAKDFSPLNYTISDYLHGMSATRGYGLEEKKIAGPDAAIPKFKQQLEIVKSLQRRFESSLFDVRAVAQADLYDNELEAAADLNRNGFFRAAGALAGVVLEGHLHGVFSNHSLTVPKKATLGVLIEDLKRNDVLDIPTWRFLQHLTDIRNLCDHKLDREPTSEDVIGLLDGVKKAIKTIY